MDHVVVRAGGYSAGVPSLRYRVLVTIIGTAIILAGLLFAGYLMFSADPEPQGPEPTVWDEPDPFF